MIENREVAVSFACPENRNRYCHKLRTFTGIKALGFAASGHFVIDLWTTPAVAPGEPRGEFFTSIPISPPAFRRQHGNGGAGFVRSPRRLTIYTDYGGEHVITAPDDILDALTGECVVQELPNLAPAPSTTGGGAR